MPAILSAGEARVNLIRLVLSRRICYRGASKGIVMNNKRKLLIPVVLLLVAGALAYWYFERRYEESGVIRLSGNIEVTDVQLAFKIPGHVEKRLVDEGQSVTQGELVAVLDSADLRKQVDVRKAELAASQAALTELLNGSRPQEIAVAAAAVESAKADAARLELDWQRAQDLYKTKVVTIQDLQTAEAATKVAAAKQREAEEQYNLVKIGPRQEEIDQARARLQAAQQSLALAEVQLGYATLTSPLTGVVLSKNIEPGDYVVPGTPVVTVADLINIWLRAYISETDLAKVKLGQKVRVTTDTYPGKVYDGRLGFIASEAEFTPKSVQTQKERVKLVYRVKIDITNTNMELKAGMPADAEIRLP
jgi:HlyD family secretion protein